MSLWICHRFWEFTNCSAQSLKNLFREFNLYQLSFYLIQYHSQSVSLIHIESTRFSQIVYESAIFFEKSLSIHRNRTIHFYRNYFLADSECPQTEDLQTNSWLVWTFLKWVFVSDWPITNLFGGPPFGDTHWVSLRISEKIISIKMGCLVTVYNNGFIMFLANSL